MRIREILSNEKYLGNALLQKEVPEQSSGKKEIPNRGELPRYYAEAPMRLLSTRPPSMPPRASCRNCGEQPDQAALPKVSFYQYDYLHGVWAQSISDAPESDISGTAQLQFTRTCLPAAHPRSRSSCSTTLPPRCSALHSSMEGSLLERVKASMPPRQNTGVPFQ